ncbi:unnamed protein product, partial [marine sediment metagenome]
MDSSVDPPHRFFVRDPITLLHRSNPLNDGIQQLQEVHLVLVFLDSFDDSGGPTPLVAQRAARAVGGLMMHANEWTIDEAVEF